MRQAQRHALRERVCVVLPGPTTTSYRPLAPVLDARRFAVARAAARFRRTAGATRLVRYTSGFAMMRFTDTGRSVNVGPMMASPVKTV